MKIILASASPSRRQILRDAGIPHESVVPDVDEEQLKVALSAEHLSPDQFALELAAAKASSVKMPNALVIGADQLLVCGGKIFGKARAIAEAKAILKELRGREHELKTAIALARDGKIVWTHVESPRLTMRDFSDAFLQSYLAKEGKKVLDFVGCYRIEGQGAQLFSRVQGDQFTIKGLPFFPLLEALRTERAIDT